VEKAYFFWGQIIRSGLQGMSGQIVDNLIAANGNRAEMKKIIDEAVIQNLEPLSRVPEVETA
jgi:hypothetical protein